MSNLDDDSLKKLHTAKNRVKLYHVNKTWMYGHDDHRLWETVFFLTSQDMWLAQDINKEINASNFNLKDPKLIGKIVACWDDPKNKNKRICEIN